MTYVSHVNTTDTNDLGAIADGRYLFGTGLGLLDVAPEDTGVSTEIDESLGLYFADCTSASCHEDDPVVW